MSNLTFQKAERKKAKVRIAIGGPAGSGKSYTALRIATGIAKKTGGRVVMIGTEKDRNEYYADEFDYDVLNLSSPYSPERYIEALAAAEEAGYRVCIVDSLTHEWHGEGGILDIKDKMPGANEFTKWSKLTPRHNAFIEKMIRCNMHIIATIRGKDQYVIEDDDKGKKVPRKIGVGFDQRDGMEYEFTTVFLLDMNHIASSQKDNTRIFDNQYSLLTEEHGNALYEWAEQGKTFIADIKEPEQLLEQVQIQKPRSKDGWGKPKEEFIDLTLEELEKIFIVCDVNPAQKEATKTQLDTLKRYPTKYKKRVDEIRERYQSIIQLDELIAKFPIDDRLRWIDEKKRCKTTEQYQEVCIEIERIIAESKIKRIFVDAQPLNPNSDSNDGPAQKKMIVIPISEKDKEIKESTESIKEVEIF